MALTKVRGAGAEGLTLSSTALTIANGLTLTDGDVTLASGHGISFSATDDGSGTVSTELLDDYEEGTFTPTLTGPSSISYNTQVGAYTKIGQTVIAHITLNIASLSGGSNYRILGWPFTPKGSASNVYGGVLRRQGALTQTDAGKYIDFYNSSLNLYAYSRGGGAYSSASHWQAGIFTAVAIYDVD